MKHITKREQLRGTFGMMEMEDAAYVICQALWAHGKYNFTQWFGNGIFQTNSERIGMIELIFGGWIQHGPMYNDTMVVSPEFEQRLSERKCHVKKHS